jgi:protein-disulfide isomerase
VRGAKFDYSDIPQSVTDDGAHVLGDPDAPITVVEFADFRCPHCQRYTEVVEQVIENHVMTGEAKFEYRFFPTTDRQGFTARLVECAVEQDANFWEAHDVMFGLTSRGWTQTSSQEFANILDLNYGELLNCVNSADQVDRDARIGVNAGVTGTPAVRVRYGDGELQPIGPQYTGGGPPYSVIQAAIERANES